jgi:hypothetical protein
MAGKFKMANGKEGMFRGQAPTEPDPFQKVDPTMPKRSMHDTEHERQAVGPQKTHANSTGFTSQCRDLLMESVMEQAITDKMSQALDEAGGEGWNAKLELEQQEKEVSAATIDKAQDSKNVEDDDLEALRARRRQQMREQFDKKAKYQALGHGSYDEIEEEAFLKTVTASDRAVVHFYHRNFEKCKVIDMHLQKCAKKFFGTRFVKLDSEKAPFFVDKLHIRMLPCVVVFNDGIAKGRQMGFEGLPGEEFETVQLAWRIKEWEGIEEEFGPEDVELFNN